MQKTARDELLELIWVKKEQFLNRTRSGSKQTALSRFGRDSAVALPSVDDLIKQDLKISSELLAEMLNNNYLTRKDGLLDFTEKGYQSAAALTRAHRLSERLFSDVLELGEKYLERNACSFEHILSPEVVESICILLSHPRECPHGYPIPEGSCCKKFAKEIQPLVVPLIELKSGATGKIVYVVTKHHQRLDQLTALGITPGITVKVHQTNPAYVIKIGETDIALDDVILKDIYVRRQ
ncbi:MAG: metal-dependent transcriptional regulator [Planctomycetota bacterium]